MKIFVKVKAGVREEGIEQIDENHFVVRVKARPVDGGANEAVIAALAGYFKVPKSRVILKSGQSSRQKVFVVPNLVDKVI